MGYNYTKDINEVQLYQRYQWGTTILKISMRYNYTEDINEVLSKTIPKISM